MIGMLRGPAVLRTAECEVIVDVGGVGYRVTVTPSTAAALMSAGTATKDAHVHTHVREDAIVLYGFGHDDERRCFEVLSDRTGSGPRWHWPSWPCSRPPRSRPRCSRTTSTRCARCRAWAKTAARLLIELKSRLDLPDLSGVPAVAPLTGPTGTGVPPGPRGPRPAPP